jgi:hypothetical protein
MHAVVGGLGFRHPGERPARVVSGFYGRPPHSVPASRKADSGGVTGCFRSSGRSRAADRKPARARASAQSNVTQAILTVVRLLLGGDINARPVWTTTRVRVREPPSSSSGSPAGAEASIDFVLRQGASIRTVSVVPQGILWGTSFAPPGVLLDIGDRRLLGRMRYRSATCRGSSCGMVERFRRVVARRCSATGHRPPSDPAPRWARTRASRRCLGHVCGALIHQTQLRRAHRGLLPPGVARIGQNGTDQRVQPAQLPHDVGPQVRRARVGDPGREVEDRTGSQRRHQCRVGQRTGVHATTVGEDDTAAATGARRN